MICEIMATLSIRRFTTLISHVFLLIGSRIFFNSSHYKQLDSIIFVSSKETLCERSCIWLYYMLSLVLGRSSRKFTKLSLRWSDFVIFLFTLTISKTIPPSFPQSFYHKDEGPWSNYKKDTDLFESESFVDLEITLMPTVKSLTGGIFRQICCWFNKNIVSFTPGLAYRACWDDFGVWDNITFFTYAFQSSKL